VKFFPGLTLNAQFYRDVVGPLIAEGFPHLRYSAALMGYGSDVLGYDNATSMDHNWGPRMQIFLPPDDFEMQRAKLDAFLRNALPLQFTGFPTNFCAPRYDRTQSMEATTSHPVNHLIELTTIDAYLFRYLGISRSAELSAKEWMAFDDQKLLEVTSGKVFHDGLGQLAEVRGRLQFFPHEVLLNRLAGLWKLVEQDEPLVGRSIELETPMGTKILAARLVEHCIRICLYLDGKYIPYPKWLIRAFETTSHYAQVQPLAAAVLSDAEPHAIEDALCALYEKVVEIHNRDGRLPRLDNRRREFFNRPYKVIFAETIVAALKRADREG